MDITKLITKPLSAIITDTSALLRMFIKQNVDINLLNDNENGMYEFKFIDNRLYYLYKFDTLDIKKNFYQSVNNNTIRLPNKLLILIKNYIKIISIIILYYTIKKII